MKHIDVVGVAVRIGPPPAWGRELKHIDVVGVAVRIGPPPAWGRELKLGLLGAVRRGGVAAPCVGA